MKVGLSLGSNLGDRLQNLQQAKNFLLGMSTGGWHLVSAVYETMPIDCPPNSPAFLNAVLEIEFSGTPRTLLQQIQAYEDAHGRNRNLLKNAARLIDIDILYFGEQQIVEPDLVVPHPRMTERRFVLLPLATIRPERRTPELPGKTAEVRFLQAEW
jgi:2-amino-4-hydroxy-6-hydroxymethyldihydropteridine diphosphokinase